MAAQPAITAGRLVDRTRNCWWSRPELVPLLRGALEDEGGDVVVMIPMIAGTLDDALQQPGGGGRGRPSGRIEDEPYTDVDVGVSPFDESVRDGEECGARRKCETAGRAVGGVDAEWGAHDRRHLSAAVRVNQQGWEVSGIADLDPAGRWIGEEVEHRDELFEIERGKVGIDLAEHDGGIRVVDRVRADHRSDLPHGGRGFESAAHDVPHDRKASAVRKRDDVVEVAAGL